jgi:4-hydroxybenzoate polyprenyltransferase
LSTPNHLSTTASYLRLTRLPNVFTALSDVVAGIVIARGARFDPHDLWLVAATALLYPAGMALNDFFDREEDARDRPERPIPSGRISARAAALFGFGLMAAGVLAAIQSGPASATVGAALALAILIYDGGAKRTFVGPLVMGLCRVLNVVLGLTAVTRASALTVLPPVAVILPIALGLYTMLLTALAAGEVRASSPRRRRGLVTALAALGVLYTLALSATSEAVLEGPGLVFVAFRSCAAILYSARSRPPTIPSRCAARSVAAFS